LCSSTKLDDGDIVMAFVTGFGSNGLEVRQQPRCMVEKQNKEEMGIPWNAHPR
jgi:hypothetical protein